jgi:hypothetical protein
MFWQNDEIQRFIRCLSSKMVTKAFTYYTFNSIAVNCPCTRLFRNGHSEPVEFFAVFPRQYLKIMIIGTDGVLENQLEFARFKQSRLPGKLHCSWPFGVYCVFGLPVLILGNQARSLACLAAACRAAVRTTNVRLTGVYVLWLDAR